MVLTGFALGGVLIFFGVLLLTILFGAAARKSETDAAVRRERDRLEGRSDDVTTSTPDPIHDRYIHT